MRDKEDKKTKRQLYFAFFSLVIMVSLIAFFVDLRDYSGFKLWLIFVTGAGLVAGYVRYIIKNYRCDDCNTLISNTKEWDRGTLHFCCDKCNVCWNTGITPSKSSDSYEDV